MNEKRNEVPTRRLTAVGFIAWIVFAILAGVTVATAIRVGIEATWQRVALIAVESLATSTMARIALDGME